MREETRGPGRPREFDEAAVLDAIMNLFWAQGYEGTSLADIMAVTGLRKASLYAAYGDKQAMYLAALGRYHEMAVDAAARALRGDGDPMDRIAAFLSAPIKAVADSGDRSGCFLCNASADQAAASPETGAIVQRGFETLAAALASTLAERHPGASIEDCEAKAWMVLSVYSGQRIMARSGVAIAHLETARDAALNGL